MTAWTSAELTRIGTADELEIASARPDGTLRNPRTIWVVRVGDDLYVRSMYGRTGGWFPATQVRHEGHIRAGGVDKDVTFTDADPGLNDQIDAASATSTAATANGSSTASSTQEREPPPSRWCRVRERRNSIVRGQKARLGITYRGAHCGFSAGGACDEGSRAWNVVNHGRSAGCSGRLSRGWADGSGRRHPGHHRAGSG